MPEQVSRDRQSEVKAAIIKIGPARGAELERRTKEVTQDLLGKLPQADKVYLEQMMFAAYCSALRDDKTISESEKGNRIKAYNNEVRKTLHGSPRTDVNSEKLAREYLQTSRNYQKDRNVLKALEYALKAYNANKDVPDIIPHLAYIYLQQGNKQSVLKAREILVVNSHRLDNTGRAILGVAEYRLDKFGAALQALGPLNLNDCNEDILPWVLIALSHSAFETLSYEDALLKMKDGLVVLDRRIALYDMRASVSGLKANLTLNHSRWYRLRMAKFHVGQIWLHKAFYAQNPTQEITDAIKLATEGMVILYDLIQRPTLVSYLALLNDVISGRRLVTIDPRFVLETLAHHIKVLSGANNKYAVELSKLELLRNCFVDVYFFTGDKQPVRLTQPIEFTLEAEAKSQFSTVRTIMISPNFAIKEYVRVSEDLPASSMNIKHTIKLAKDDFFDKAENFAFQLNVKDSSGQETNKNFCPNFFANQVNA
jgi:tetratricopeptide (TPR) repeat protein